ncbi:uncharacterized protein LOC117480493 [Trematomus bernacchii]|uniref:uncharacterized protein LOC117480493 n=1 Tax=Trematomus bernacchii TaxID=40690 RepID=UPI00146A1567|nr:uncharacterized protein LOC117480493 [Trematomus bernacchii]
MMMMMINRPLKGDPLGARAKNQQISCVPMGSGEAVPVCHLFRLVASHLTGLHTSWIIPSHPADFFYLFFFFFILPALFFSTGGTALVVLSSTPGRFLIFRGSAFVVLRVFPADLRLSAVLPPLCVCCLRWSTPTPGSFFLRTRKRLALLTPSRGLALAGLEKRPPGWAGHRGGREREREGEGGRARRGSGSDAIGQERCLSRSRWRRRREVGRFGDPAPPPISASGIITAIDPE